MSREALAILVAVSELIVLYLTRFEIVPIGRDQIARHDR